MMKYPSVPEDTEIKEREWPEADREKSSVGLAESWPRIDFDKSDMKFIKWLALKRTKAKNDKEDLSDMDNARHSTIASDSDNFDEVTGVHEAGAAGEYAFAEYYDFDFPYSEEGVLDDGYDFVVRLGATGDWLTIDVKATKQVKVGPLRVQQMRGARADLFFLVDYYDEEEYAELVGFAPSALIEKCPIRKNTNQDGYHYNCHRKKLTEVPTPEELEIIPWERYVEVFQ